MYADYNFFFSCGYDADESLIDEKKSQQNFYTRCVHNCYRFDDNDDGNEHVMKYFYSNIRV